MDQQSPGHSDLSLLTDSEIGRGPKDPFLTFHLAGAVVEQSDVLRFCFPLNLPFLLLADFPAPPFSEWWA